MSKSLRSKWKRKMRAVKRVRYSAKELAKLNQMLLEAGELLPNKVEIKIEKMDEEVEEPAAGTPNPETFTIEDSAADVIIRGSTERQSRMDTYESTSIGSRTDSRPNRGPNRVIFDDLEKLPMVPRVFSRSTMKDQFGQYPVWMGKRKMKTQVLKNKRKLKKSQKMKKIK